MNEKELYELAIGTEKKMGSTWWVLRVPGGWIFSDVTNDTTTAAVFVPFSQEQKITPVV